MAAARLRQTAAHDIADAENHDIQPRLIGPEVVAVPVGRSYQVGRKQHPDRRR